MTTYYVDNAAAGTGDGLSPANAFTSIINRSVVWADGDYVWARRSHVESAVFASQLGGTLGYQNRMVIAGWPSSGAPFYEMRPAAGVSAGWDNDHSALAVLSTYSLDFPTLSTSCNAVGNAINVRTGTTIANVCFDNFAPVAPTIPAALLNQHVLLDNIVFLRNQGPHSGLNLSGGSGKFGTITVVDSGSTTGTMIVPVERYVLHGASVFSSAIFSSPFDVDLLHIKSSSVAHICVPLAENAYPLTSIQVRQFPGYIRRVVGTKPNSGAVHPNTSAPTLGGMMLRVDDYFSEGPIMRGDGGFAMRVGSSGEAQYNGGKVLVLTVGTPSPNNYARSAEFMDVIRLRLTVTNGTPVTIAVPVYVDSTAIFSLSNGFMRAHLACAGGAHIRITASHVVSGSQSMWTGSMVAASSGAPYYVVASFLPTETGSTFFQIGPPGYTTSLAASVAKAGYCLYGEPFLL